MAVQGGLFSRELLIEPYLFLSDEAKKTNVVLSSIKFYCPTTMKSTYCGLTSALRKRFSVTIEYQSLPINFLNEKIRCNQFDVETDEGKTVEVKLAGQVPLWIGHRYSIVVRVKHLY